MTKRIINTVAVIVSTGIAGLIAPSAEAAVYVDFGDTATTGGAITWNNLLNSTPNATLTDLATEGNAPSGIRLAASGWSGAAASGGKADVLLTGAAGTAFGTSGTASVQADYLFGGSGTVTLSQLDPTKTYTITTYGNRNSGGNRNATYAATGANVASGSHDAVFNTTNVTTLSDVVPSANNTIVLTVTQAAGNTSGFVYLNALRIDVNDAAPVPEPTALAGLVTAGAAALATRRRRQACR